VSRRVNMTEGMLDVISAALASVEAGGDDHEAVPDDPTEAAEFWRNADRLNVWLRQEHARRGLAGDPKGCA
jgi:hypothetical protein